MLNSDEIQWVGSDALRGNPEPIYPLDDVFTAAGREDELGGVNAAGHCALLNAEEITDHAPGAESRLAENQFYSSPIMVPVPGGRAIAGLETR